jgi:anthranilate synthase component 2
MNMKLLVLDNYDSFTYNLVHMIRELGHDPDIYRNDKISLGEVGKYDKILISPGPGIPGEAGILKFLVESYGSSKSILGVCLGHQGIAEVYGSKLFNLANVLHGVTTNISVTDDREKLFRDIPRKFKATHYHSWAVDSKSMDPSLAITAINEEGLVMALSHKKFDVKGVQFHPESIMTEHGSKLIANWINS